MVRGEKKYQNGELSGLEVPIELVVAQVDRVEAFFLSQVLYINKI